MREYQQRIKRLNFTQARVLRIILGHVHMLPFRVQNVVSEHIDSRLIGPIDIAIFVQGGYKIAVQVNGP